MDKKVNVIGGEDFKNAGMFFYCTNDDIQSYSKKEILEWFGEAKRISLENEKDFKIMAIEPIVSLANKAAVLIKIDTKNIPTGIFPTTASIH